MTKEDIVIILGDFGIWNGSELENYNLNWLENCPFTTLFVSGNHDNYDILDNLQTEIWKGGKVSFLRPSVIYLHRGQVFSINDKQFFAFGGASSHDINDGILEKGDLRIKTWSKDPLKMFRINHLSWWERELSSNEEMKEGWENLELYNCVDYILTHSPYTSILNELDGGVACINQIYRRTICKIFASHSNIRSGYLDTCILTRHFILSLPSAFMRK